MKSINDKPISVGDLVQVVRPKNCCGRITQANGIFYKVTQLSFGQYHCVYCDTYHETEPMASGDGRYLEVYRLKRIPPLSELERADEMIKETT